MMANLNDALETVAIKEAMENEGDPAVKHRYLTPGSASGGIGAKRIERGYWEGLTVIQRMNDVFFWTMKLQSKFFFLIFFF